MRDWLLYITLDHYNYTGTLSIQPINVNMETQTQRKSTFDDNVKTTDSNTTLPSSTY